MVEGRWRANADRPQCWYFCLLVLGLCVNQPAWAVGGVPARVPPSWIWNTAPKSIKLGDYSVWRQLRTLTSYSYAFKSVDVNLTQVFISTQPLEAVIPGIRIGKYQLTPRLFYFGNALDKAEFMSFEILHDELDIGRNYAYARRLTSGVVKTTEGLLIRDSWKFGLVRAGFGLGKFLFGFGLVYYIDKALQYGFSKISPIEQHQQIAAFATLTSLQYLLAVSKYGKIGALRSVFHPVFLATLAVERLIVWNLERLAKNAVLGEVMSKAFEAVDKEYKDSGRARYAPMSEAERFAKAKAWAQSHYLPPVPELIRTDTTYTATGDLNPNNLGRDDGIYNY